MTEQNELVVIEPANIPALFQKDGCDPIIEGLKKEAAKFKGDIATAKGRKEIASFARKFSTAKTYLDSLGKTLSDEYRAKIAPINAERNKIETCCNELRDKIRKPLTDWENAEKERVARHEQNIQTINDYLNVDIEDSSRAKELLDALKEFDVGEVFEEFELAATKAKEAVLIQLEAKFIVLQSAEKEKAEAERLGKDRLAKKQKEREEKIAEEAAETARKEAEEEAAKEAEEKERKEKEEREKLEKEKLQLQLDKEKAERETKAAEDRAEQEKKEAAEQAEKDKQQAIEDERKRQASVLESERIEREKAASNKAHRGKINRQAKASFITAGINEKESEKIIKLIAKGEIANITINY